MKKYNISNYIRYKKDVIKAQTTKSNLDEYTRDELICKFLPMVENLAKKFSTSQQASGVLDITDLIQFGSIGLIQAVDKIEWDRIVYSASPEQTFKAFISKRIKGAIRRSINMNRSDMRLPEHVLNTIHNSGEDHAMTALFFNSVFSSTDEQFDTDTEQVILQHADISEPYNVHLMNAYLLGIMRKYLSDMEYEVLRLSFGLDQEKMSAKEVAIHLGLNVSTATVRICQIKKNGIDKLIINVDPKLVQDFI
jgi:RNA polymerase sigma factor (sigma-70 family)